MIWTIASSVCGVVLVALLALVLWWRWLMAGVAKISADPYTHPKLGWRDIPPRSLRKPAFAGAAAHLESLGFRELGTQVETTLLRSTPARQFVHDDGTIVGMYSVLRKPAYYALSEFRGAITLVFTGAPRRPKLHGELLVGGVLGTIDEILESHRTLIGDAKRTHTLEPVACETPEHRQELARRYYVQHYTNEGRYFQPFQNPIRLKL